MAKFKTELRANLISNAGSGVWQLASPFVYVTDVLDTVLVVPPGFVTDFASVPRLPLVYSLVGNIGHAPAVIHDWLYSPKCKEPCTRKQADDVFYEALVVCGVAKWRAWSMWIGVRMGGGQFWKAR